MPLFVDTSVGDGDARPSLDSLKVTRLDATDEPGDDEVFTYRVAKRAEGRWQEIGRVEHRYGDGRVELSIKAMTKLREHYVKHGDPHAVSS